MNWLETITTLVAITNSIWIIWSSWKKNKPEVKKLEADVDSEIVEAAVNSLEGAKISGEMLLNRINELKIDLETEKASRKSDADYFRRRLRESDKEARDYRIWAARLAKQVIEAGKIPVSFEPTPSESDTHIPRIAEKEQDRRKDDFQ